MAPSAISMDPVSQLEAEASFILEAATTDVKSDNAYQPVKPALKGIITELPSEDSTEPTTPLDGFTDTPPSGVAVMEDMATEFGQVVEPTKSAPTAIFTEIPSETAELSPALDGFTDTPTAGVVSEEQTTAEPVQVVEQAQTAPTDIVTENPITEDITTEFPSETAPASAAVEEQTTTEPTQVVEPAKPVLEDIITELPSENSTEPSSPLDGVTDTPPICVAGKEQATVAASTNKWLELNSVITQVSEPMSGAKKLRKMIFETNELIICPGVYDGLSARTAIDVGFNALYMTGAGTTASRLGQPDLAIAQLHEMRENAEMIASLDPFGPPLIADMDTGYGGPIMAARTVEQYIRSGVAGAHLEDQVLMKRCGHLGGKKVVPVDEYIARIRAAHGARVRLQSDFVLIARTDALQQLGYDECIQRLRMARDEGADVGLLEGFSTKEQAAQAVKDLAPWPLLLNSVENGKSPLITIDEARKMGFRIMIFSFATLAPAYIAMRDTLMRLKTQGVVGTPPDITPIKLFEVCGLNHSMAVDMNAGGASFGEEL